MKILLIFTFYLISGPVGCFDVIGYSGGTVMIYCKMPNNRGDNPCFCKDSGRKCVHQNPDTTSNTWDHKDRVSVVQSNKFLTVTYRDLSSDDAGSYQCGKTGGGSDTVKLTVKTDKCCSGPKNVIGYLGETVTISCSYPEEFKDKAKFFYKDDFKVLLPIVAANDPQKNKFSSSEIEKESFSISEDESSNVVSAIIGDVIQEDEGDYYCGVAGDEGASNYETFFSKIHLQITATPTTPGPPAPPAPTVPTSAKPSGLEVIIPVVAVLLIGALLFFIVILKKRRGSTPSARTHHSDNKAGPAVVSNDEETELTTPTTPPNDQDPTYSTVTPPKDQELTYSSVNFHKNPGSPTDASVSVNKEEPETEYATVKHPTALE